MTKIEQEEAHLKVMIIDDNKGEMIIVKAALSNTALKNIELEFYQNPLKALDYLQELVKTEEGRSMLPDIIFLDIGMPVMRGPELLGILKNMKELNMIPIVIVTTGNLDHEVKECYALHANSVMIKPFDFDEYCDMLELTLKYWLYVSANRKTTI